MANGLTTRSSVESLQSAPNGLDPLRDAYAKMQKLSDNRGWIYWAKVHGFDQNMCWHHNRLGLGQPKPYDLFLPWHRAYLLYWEHTARDQNAAMTLPWWDWTSSGSHSVGIPKSFVTPVSGNSLANGPRPAMPGKAAGRTSRRPGPPSGLPTAKQVSDLMALGSFVDFSSQLQDIHDQVHGWIGGDMGVIATAAFDPIFWSHHCMIDRIWYIWQIKNGPNTIPTDYLNKPLAPFSLTVEAVLDINRLGYEYADSSATVAGKTT